MKQANRFRAVFYGDGELEYQFSDLRLFIRQIDDLAREASRNGGCSWAVYDNDTNRCVYSGMIRKTINRF